jgi:hypothetical protein
MFAVIHVSSFFTSSPERDQHREKQCTLCKLYRVPILCDYLEQFFLISKQSETPLHDPHLYLPPH